VRATRSPHTLRAAFRRQALLAALLLGLALLRALLPVRAVGALAVRSRGLDVAVLLLLALAIAALTTSPNL
jgi:ABC-type enterochelin transport system permease subunit